MTTFSFHQWGVRSTTLESLLGGGRDGDARAKAWAWTVAVQRAVTHRLGSSLASRVLQSSPWKSGQSQQCDEKLRTLVSPLYTPSVPLSRKCIFDIEYIYEALPQKYTLEYLKNSEQKIHAFLSIFYVVSPPVYFSTLLI
jgi:hypothetical protein